MIIEFIGINATVLSRARVKRGSIVAAGSVVIEDQQIEPYHLATGVPARVKKGLRIIPRRICRFLSETICSFAPPI